MNEKILLDVNESNSKSFRRFEKMRSAIVLIIAVFLFAPAAEAQKIALLTPDDTARSANFAAELGKHLSRNYRMLDASLSAAAFRAARAENPFNLSSIDAKNIGSAIGANYFLLVRHELLRRSSFAREEYYEAYAVIYTVSSRTGELVFWKLSSFDADTPSAAEKTLFDSVKNLSGQIVAALENAKSKESIAEEKIFEEIPADGSPEAKNLRPPLPYRRIKPEYTEIADFYNIAATIDILVDIDEKGNVVRTQITRWAGYELDEAVAEAVRKMNWRPADRSGKPLPMRVLLRYNFRDIKDEKP